MIVRCNARRLPGVAQRIGGGRGIHAVLNDRRVYSITGKDTNRLLQNLITNDVNKIEGIQASAFLTPQGRVIGPTILYKASDEQSTLFMELDESVAEAVMAHVKRFKLRSKTTFTDVSQQHAVVAHWNGDESPSDAIVSGADPRVVGMGSRSIVLRSSPFVQGISAPNIATESEKRYDIDRLTLGVAEEEMANGLPLETNVDLMNGVDYRKGCYVGQELTARTHHTGIVRKRIMPVAFYAQGEDPPAELKYDDSKAALAHVVTNDVRGEPMAAAPDGGKPSKGRSAGKVLAQIGNVGLAMLRLEQVHRWNEDLLMHAIAEDGTRVNVRPFMPDWWPEEVRSGTQG